MKLLSRRDVVSAGVTGLTTGLIAWRILVFLGMTLPFGIRPSVLVVVLPVVWIIAIQMSYALASRLPAIPQFAKFSAIGFGNALVDFGVLYLFIGLTGYTDGGHYALFKAVAFTAGIIHSYVWNKYWAFEAGASGGGGRELASFIAVSLVALSANVAIASLTVALGPPRGLDVRIWAGIGAAVGSALSPTISFFGLRFFVFCKK